MNSCIIVGGGIVGLATALKLLERHPGAKLTLLEKEAGVARHQSTHNSGVLHCGLYYKPGSLKAKLAVTGIREMVAFCRTHDIPHRGTWLARLALSVNMKEMQIDSHWQQLLGTREPAQRPARFTCFYGHCDNIVFPPSTATLRGADNRHLPAVAHVRMVDHPAPWNEVQARLVNPVRS